MTRWFPAYVGLGANLGDPQAQVSAAFAQLAELPRTRLLARSRLYHTRPMGPQEQPPFVNAAAGLLTQLEPGELLAGLKRIEAAMGREPPPVHWGPRLIDLDLLLYGSVQRDEPGLTLPHPGLLARNFVLYPLADIAPTLRLPDGTCLAARARALGDDGLSPIR